MLPFGQTVYVWRRQRGLRQAQLAEAAGIPRPNLSAIERGKREVSLGTLRALARALEVRPGLLVDGVPPPLPNDPSRLPREALERVAAAVVGNTVPHDPTERALADWLHTLCAHRLRRIRGRRQPRSRVHTIHTAWLNLKANCSRDLLRSLIDRVENQLHTHGTQTH